RDCRVCERGPNKTIHASECSIVGQANRFMRTSERNGLRFKTVPLPERRIGLCLPLRAGNRRHARDRQQRVVPEFARAPGGEVYVRGTAASARDGTANWAERKPCNARQLMR